MAGILSAGWDVGALRPGAAIALRHATTVGTSTAAPNV
jgi:hypothetical protein